MKIYKDIETIPQQPESELKKVIAETIEAPSQMKKPETLAEWHQGTGKYVGVKEALIESKYRATALDGASGSICSISAAIEDGTPDIFHCMPEPAGYKNEADMLAAFFMFVRDNIKGKDAFFVGHYISGFDLRFLYQRAVINQVDPGFNLGESGRHNQQFFDTMFAWAGYKGTISLDNLCKALGLPGKSDDIDGSKVWDFYKAGKFNEIIHYNIDDAERVRNVYKRLAFIK